MGADNCYDDESKKKWYSATSVISENQLKLGCLQRIANATEAMARNYKSLIDERDRFKRWHEEEQKCNNSLRRTVAALRGHLNRKHRDNRGGPQQGMTKTS